VEIRVCDTPLTVERAAALAALAQSLVRHLLRTRPVLNTQRHLYVARYNKFQACRYGFDAQISDPIGLRQVPLRQIARELLAALAEDARANLAVPHGWNCSTPPWPERSFRRQLVAQASGHPQKPERCRP
jgi:gamma-glutamyl:cysteine ligase YbdK (ATP-grasp superfamily)